MNLYDQLQALHKSTPARLAARLAELDTLSDADIEDQYRDMLDEIYGPVSVCGFNYDAANALASIDPTAYRCGLADYISENETHMEWNGAYYSMADLDEVIESLGDEP